MEKIPDDILEKIQKIINYKESSEAIGNQEQVEVASLSLQKLLMKHNLSLDAITEASIEKRVRVNVEEVYINTEPLTKHSESFWIPKLYAGVARNNLCRVWCKNASFRVNIIGHSHNIALVEYICDQLIAKIRMSEKFAWKQYESQNKDNLWAEKRGTFRRGFLEGCAVGITNRLEDEYWKMEHGYDNNPLAVMIVSKKAEINEFLYTKYPSMRPGYINPNPPEPSVELTPTGRVKKEKKYKPLKGPRKNSSTDGWFAGREAGKVMEINKGVKDQTNTIKGKIN